MPLLEHPNEDAITELFLRLPPSVVEHSSRFRMYSPTGSLLSSTYWRSVPMFAKITVLSARYARTVCFRRTKRGHVVFRPTRQEFAL
jgi:hypothetical protein